MRQDEDDCLSPEDAAVLEGSVNHMCAWIVGVLALGLVAVAVWGE